jgi:hypothetical protein
VIGGEAGRLSRKGSTVRWAVAFARIVTEVFVGRMQGDDTSYLTQELDWRPFLPTIDPARWARISAWWISCASPGGLAEVS